MCPLSKDYVASLIVRAQWLSCLQTYIIHVSSLLGRIYQTVNLLVPKGLFSNGSRWNFATSRLNPKAWDSLMCQRHLLFVTLFVLNSRVPYNLTQKNLRHYPTSYKTFVDAAGATDHFCVEEKPQRGQRKKPFRGERRNQRNSAFFLNEHCGTDFLF